MVGVDVSDDVLVGGFFVVGCVVDLVGEKEV